MVSEPVHPDDFRPNPVADRFYDAALERIRHMMLVLGLGAVLVAAMVYGWKVALGVLLGSIVAWLNFVWLKQAIGVLADKVTSSGRAKSSASTVAKFLLRYALVGIGAYAIFLSSRQSLYGFLAGLFLAVAAILCEAAYETFVGLRRGF